MHVLTLTTNEDAPFMTQQMAALERRGVSFSTLSVPGTAKGSNDRSVTDYLRFFATVYREADDEYDLIHAHYGLTAPMALAQRRLPVVLSLWGSDLLGSIEPLSRLCARRCAEVIVMSPEMERRLGTECAVIPDGVDLDRFAPRDRTAARESVGWSSDEYHVLFPYPPTRSVKNYPRAKRIVDRADERLEKPVRLQRVYGVDHARIPDYVNAADVLLLTSHSEGSPNAVKEAMACNVPVVSTDVGDVAERLQGVDPSRVCSTDTALVSVLVDVLERAERSNGREAVREVCLQQTTDAILDVYARVAGERPEERPVPRMT